MSDQAKAPDRNVPDAARDDKAPTPLPEAHDGADVGSQTRQLAVSKKGLLAAGLLVSGVVAVAVLGIQRLAVGGQKADNDGQQRSRPAAASAKTPRLEMTAPAASSSKTGMTTQVPALTPVDDEPADPIRIRQTPPGAAGAAGGHATTNATDTPKPWPPEDAAVLLVSMRPASSSAERPAVHDLPAADGGADVDALAATTRHLQAYQHQLQGMLEQLTRGAEMAGSSSGPAAPRVTAPAAGTPSPGLIGGQPPRSSPTGVVARFLGTPSLTVPKGTTFNCALKTRVVSANSGLVGCQVQRHVFSADGRVLLIERGSHVDGEYRITSVRPGVVRIPVLWTRIRTPLGVVVELEAPATGPLGESGIDGHVDNRWSERIGAAMLLSLIDDAVKLVVQGQANERQGSTIVLPSTTSNTSRLAEKVLDSTINMPPLIERSQGGIVGVHVARDIDFSAVYGLLPSANPTPAP